MDLNSFLKVQMFHVVSQLILHYENWMHNNSKSISKIFLDEYIISHQDAAYTILVYFSSYDCYYF